MVDYSYYITPESYDIAEQNGICRATLETRIRYMGWGTKRATTTPPQPRKPYGEWAAVAVKNGISKKNYIQRVNLGWDCERAATEPVRSRADQGKAIGKSRRKYPQQYIDMAEKNGVCYSTFKSRMAEGWTLEEASTEKVVSYSEAGKRGKGWRAKHKKA